MISLHFNIIKNNIKLYLHSEITENLFDKNKLLTNNLLNNNVLLKELIDKSYDFIICEII